MTGEIYENFVDKFILDQYLVNKYEKIVKIQLFLIASAGFIGGAIVLLGESDDQNPQPEWMDPVFNLLPDIMPSSYHYGVQADVLILYAHFIIFGLVIFRLFQLRLSSEIDSQLLYYHYLASAVQSINNKEINSSDVVNYLDKSLSTLFHPLFYVGIYPTRKYQIKRYVSKLNGLEGKQLENEINSTFDIVVKPIIEEIYTLSDDQEIDDAIDNIQISDSQPSKVNRGLLIDFFNPIFKFEWGKLVTLVVLVIGALAIGFTFGQQWAIILLTALVVYLGFVNPRN